LKGIIWKLNFRHGLKTLYRIAERRPYGLGMTILVLNIYCWGLFRDGDGVAIKLLRGLNVDTAKLRRAVEDAVKGTTGTNVHIGSIPLTKQAEKVLKITYLEAKIFKSDVIGTEHLLLSILRDEDNIASQLLLQFNVNYEIFKHEVDAHKNNVTDEMPGSPTGGDDDFKEEDSFSQPKKVSDIKSKTPVLDNFRPRFN
jgi:ATP-dependent Clp protease ATP-binding subunit ClpC